MNQTSWLPEKIKRVEPNPTASADSPGIGVAHSHQRYILKAAFPGQPLLPASEWASHGLAFALDLPVPHWCVCELPNGQQCFGSRMEGAIVSNHVLPNSLDCVNPEVMSHTFVFDLLLGNEDRHPGNWLLTETGGAKILRPIDFSRALLWRWPPSAMPPWPEPSNSGQYYKLAWMLKTCDKTAAESMLDSIVSLKKDKWVSIVDSIPGPWLSDAGRRELVNWWWSPIWRVRVKWIEGQL